MTAPTEIQTSLHHDFPSFRLFLLPNQETDKQHQRHHLRKTLVTSLKDNHYSTTASLEDLLSLPIHNRLSLSLSHCSEFSAYAWCEKPKRLGIDIESLLKLKKETVARVCNPDEIKLSPRYELLWSCKESVFKALSPQINVLSFVDIFDWKSLRGDTTSDTWQFSARVTQSKTRLSGRGEVRLILGHVLAFFISDS